MTRTKSEAIVTVLKKCLYTLYSVGEIMDYTEEQYNFFYK